MGENVHGLRILYEQFIWAPDISWHSIYKQLVNSVISRLQIQSDMKWWKLNS